ncbi:MAG: xanthine dehydrogenase family protein [Elusimicrobia bacterium]|nr:xanthine dehydrogenase family protein [Elusimicrobiota bacterium]
MRIVGTSAQRKEGIFKLRGQALYVDDYKLKNCLYGATLRSAIAFGRIKKIEFDPDYSWQNFIVVTAKDIPGKNCVTLIEQDQPLLAEERVLHPMEPIVLVAHSLRSKAYEALNHIKVEYEAHDPVLTIEDSLAKKQILRRPDNVFKRYEINKGNIKEGFTKADFIVEGEYRAPHQEQAYIENNGVSAWVENDGTIVARGSLQCPYYVHKALKIIFNLPDDKIRVIQAATGGGFGGKEEYPSMLAGHAALLALKSGRPVKMIYDRHEDMLATTKRHPAIIRHKTGLAKDGKLTAQDIEIIMDAGAYITLSPVVLSRGTLHATGPYECPNVRVRSRAVATNSPPNGAFRGFGAPQTLFAAELHMEKLAQKAGIDSLELRRRNIFKTGSKTATGQVLKESVGISRAMKECAGISRYARIKKECDRWNKNTNNPTWRGIGMALAFHGGGFTGSGEVMLASRAAVALTKGGKIEVLAASTEIGQGATTIFAQIAAQALGVPYEWVEVAVPDTGRVPNSGPTVASRTTMIIGGLVRRAALQLKDEFIGKAKAVPKTRAALIKAAKLLCKGKSEVRFEVQFEKPGEIVWDEAAYKGDAYGVFSYGAVVVELEVDKLTYEVRLRNFFSAQDIGKAVNPLLAQGQIMGGSAQALGWALFENAVYKDGVMQNANFTDYLIPTALDTPAMKIKIIEEPYSHGPFGAKGLGEMPADIPVPAVAAAVYHATGLWFGELPILPEKICHEMLNRYSHNSLSPCGRGQGEG